MDSDDEIDWDDTEGHEVCGAVDEAKGYGPCTMRLHHPMWTGHFDSRENVWPVVIERGTPTNQQRRRFRTVRGALAALGLRDDVVIGRIEAIVEQHENEWSSEAGPYLGGLEYWIPPSAQYVAVGDAWDKANGRVFAYLHRNRVEFEDGTVKHVD